jgi:hypothetical protein
MRKLIVILAAVLMAAFSFGVTINCTPTEIDGTSFTEITAVDLKATSTTFYVSFTTDTDKIGLFFDIDIGSATDTSITIESGDYSMSALGDLAKTGITADKKYWVGPLDTMRFLQDTNTIEITVTSSTIQTAINLYAFKFTL